MRGAKPLLAALAAGLALSAGAAQEPEGWAYDVANELMSPWCPGRSLADCPSHEAETLRMWLVVQEAAGRPRAEVEAEVVERFGDAILAAPRAEGFGLAAYALPIAVFLLGGALVAVVLRRVTARPATPAAPAAAAVSPARPDPDLERIVDEELLR